MLLLNPEAKRGRDWRWGGRVSEQGLAASRDKATSWTLWTRAEGTTEDSEIRPQKKLMQRL